MPGLCCIRTGVWLVCTSVLDKRPLIWFTLCMGTNNTNQKETPMNIITHTSKTIILCPGRVKRNTPVIIMRDLDSLGVQCRLVTGGTPFICDKSDLRYYEEAGV